MFRIITDATKPTIFLCKTCVHARIATAVPETNSRVLCVAGFDAIKTHVVECTNYTSKQNARVMNTFGELAVILDMDYRGNPVWSRDGRPYNKKRSRARISRRSATVRSNPVAIQ